MSIIIVYCKYDIILYKYYIISMISTISFAEKYYNAVSCKCGRWLDVVLIIWRNILSFEISRYVKEIFSVLT